MHFHAGRAVDVLDRAEQVRVAERFGYGATAGQLPVERFMQRYFRHSRHVHVRRATRFVAHARSRERLDRFLTTVFGHGIEPGVGVGPRGLVAAPVAVWRARPTIWRASRGWPTWPAATTSPFRRRRGRRSAGARRGWPKSLRREACRHFLSLLDHPAQLAPLLRDLHAIGACDVSSRRWPAPAASCSSTSITSTRSTSTAFRRSGSPRGCCSTWGRWGGPIGRSPASGCCTWPC